MAARALHAELEAEGALLGDPHERDGLGNGQDPLGDDQPLVEDVVEPRPPSAQQLRDPRRARVASHLLVVAEGQQDGPLEWTFGNVPSRYS